MKDMNMDLKYMQANLQRISKRQSKIKNILSQLKEEWQTMRKILVKLEFNQ